MKPPAPSPRSASASHPPGHAATRSRWAAACWAGAVLGALAASTCRKPAPDEVVNTGAAPTNTTLPTTFPTVLPPLPTNTAGAAGSAGNPGSAGAGLDPGPFSKAALLAAVAECTSGRYRDFEASARVLRDAAAEHASGPTEERAGRVRGAWLATTALWQEAEPFRFGPAAGSLEPGGRDLRAQIYSWPEVSRCKVEEQIVSQTYAGPGFATSLVNGRGLFSLEYLSFFVGNTNACSQFSVINAQGTWAALSPDELTLRKAAYGAASAADVLARAGELVAAWAPEGPFRDQFVRAGAGSTVFPGEQDALNAVSNGMFYVEKEVKDFKLGRPLGYYECSASTCPELVEARFSRNSVANVRSNLRGFARLFSGCGEGGTGLGFDDWLSAVGADDLAGRLRGALAEAEATAAATDLPIDEAVATDPAKAAALHASIKSLTDLLKTEFITVLNLELPSSSEGDND